jgi:hypothetical protein
MYEFPPSIWISIPLALVFLGWFLDSLLLVVISIFSDLRNMGTFSQEFPLFFTHLELWRLLNHVPKPRRFSSVPPGVPWRVWRTL